MLLTQQYYCVCVYVLTRFVVVLMETPTNDDILSASYTIFDSI